MILDKVLSNTDKDLEKRKIEDYENNEISHFFKVEKEVILKQSMRKLCCITKIIEIIP